jgi:hypothetical protein
MSDLGELDYVLDRGVRAYLYLTLLGSVQNLYKTSIISS